MAISTGAAILGATVGSALIGSKAAGDAADTQSEAANNAAALQRQTAQEQLALQERIYNEGVARQQPWLGAGTNALARMQGGEYALPGAFTGQVDLNQDPGYQFRLSEGMKGLERSAAARGGLLSGATLKGVQRYGQDMASQEYQNAYGRAMDVYNSKVNQSNTGYNRLASLAGVGQTTANTLGQAGQNYASQAGNTMGQMASSVGDAMTSGAAARASGYVGQTNALTGGLNTYLNYQNSQNMMNMFRPNHT